MFKFIHAADIHLDSPLRGLASHEDAPVEEIRGASRKALQNLVQLAMDENVSFVIVSGDVFDGDWKDYKTGLFFIGQMARLRKADIRVFLVSGNHDAQNQIVRSLRWPENVHQFSTRTIETQILEEINVAIHGRGFPSRAVTEDWVPRYPEPSRGVFNIGVLHTSLGGYSDYETYAPCSLNSLLNKGYDYWALGHVHQREVLNESPYVVFPGNIQGRHARECDPKGCMLVTVDEGEVRDMAFRELDVVRWANLDLSVTARDGEDDVLEKMRRKLGAAVKGANGKTLAIRVMISGPCLAHDAFRNDPEKWRNEFRAAAVDTGDIWLEKIIFNTSPPEHHIWDDAGLFAKLHGYLREKQEDNETLISLGLESLKKLREKLPSELTAGENNLPFEDPAWLRQTLNAGLEKVIGNIKKDRCD